MIRVACPGCHSEFDCSDFLAGLTVVCKGCSHRVPVPGGRPPSAPTKEAVAPVPAPVAVAPKPALDEPVIPSGTLNSMPLNERAAAMLNAGMPAHVVEQRLVGLGLTPDFAEVLVRKLVDERARREAELRRQEDEDPPSPLWSPQRWFWGKLEGKWWGQLLISAFLFLFALLLYMGFTEMETKGGSVRIPWVLVAVYHVAGKWGCVLLLTVPGAVYAVLGFQNMPRSPGKQQ
jgi:hypothetical protein